MCDGEKRVLVGAGRIYKEPQWRPGPREIETY